MANPILYNGVATDHSIYQVKAEGEQTLRVGTRGFLPDGRVFYYTRNTGAAALNRGQLYVRGDFVANHQNLATDHTLVAVGSNVLGVGSVTPGATAVTANQYAEGLLVVTDAGGEGSYYKIRENTAFTSATADGSITLYDEIAVAFDASTTVSLHVNAFDNPQISNTDQNDVAVGVPTFTIPIGSTTAQYGWLQTWGECPVLFDEAVGTTATRLTIGTAVQGAVEAEDLLGEPMLGYNIADGVDTEYQLVDLRIKP